jgi:hypothetical protein
MPAEDRRLQRRDDRLPSIRQVVEVSQSLTALQESPEVLRETLLRIAETAMEVLEADLVDLYQYRADRDEFVLPPIMVGERRFPRLVPKQVFLDDVVVKIARTGEGMCQGDDCTSHHKPNCIKMVLVASRKPETVSLKRLQQLFGQGFSKVRCKASTAYSCHKKCHHKRPSEHKQRSSEVPRTLDAENGKA